MIREDLSDLIAFLAVARERSFTKAAGKLGVSQSALSHTIRRFEARLGLRLLTRTTRSVAPTQAGERLLSTVGPHLDEVDSELSALAELRDKPAGTIRITTSDHAANTILLPKLAPLLRDYPDIKVELFVDYGLKDIVAERYDAGVRLGEHLARGMIAVPIGPPMRMVVVGTRGYFERHPPPKKPQDLPRHCCINLSLPSGIYAWEFEKGGREMKVRVEGQVTVNGVDEALSAARAGIGLAFVPADLAASYLTNGTLETVLDSWSPPFSGFHLYYPSRRQSSPAFSLLVDALRYH
ncbi:MAG TPA: LysR family transcriptional regulator [Myxococcota bacterium]|nr:LysR family transcriptional regulator [Myxococcota bacterium]